MPGDDALSAAIEELYSLDPQSFTARRGELATRARQIGDGTTARAISGLRRPTRAAWIINRLVRDAPGVASGLAELGAQLREAQRSLDGTRLRQLTQQRRRMIDAASRQALAGQAAPSAALRHEVASTLEAGLADPDVAERLSTGTLVRSAEWSGFGDSAPTLSAVPTSGPHRPPPAASPAANRTVATKSPRTASPAANHAAPTQVRAEPRQQEQKQARAAATTSALAEANEELHSATAAELKQVEKVRLLTEQLSDARRRLDEARLSTRQARARQREAERRLDRTRR